MTISLSFYLEMANLVIQANNKEILNSTFTETQTLCLKLWYVWTSAIISLLKTNDFVMI